MLESIGAIKKKLFGLPEQFEVEYISKRYPQAKHVYNTAVTVSVFLEMPEEESDKLFQRFNEEQVQKAYWECIKKNKTSENEPYIKR